MELELRMKPRVSVIMAVHNDEAYVREALDSVLAQSFTDFELIVIDDGSTDGSFALVKAFPDPRLRVLQQDNQGLTRSLIRGCSQARGEYLARQDADDISQPLRLEEQVEFLDQNPEVGLVGTMASIIDEAGRHISTRRLEVRPGIGFGKLSQENQFVHGSIMMRKDAYEQIGGYREFFRYAQDYDLILRLAEHWETANLAEPHYKHRMRADEVSIRYNCEQMWFRDIARMLHRERAAGRPDSLDSGELAAAPSEGQAGEGDHVDTYRIRYIHTCLRSGLLRDARKEIVHRLGAKPLQIKSYVHFALTFVNARLVVALLGAWDRVRNNSERITWARVTFVISSMEVGGAERVLAIMANHWAAQGKEVRILSLAAPEEAPFYALDHRVRYIGLGLVGSSANGWDALRRNVGRIRTLRKAVRTAAPDVVISFMTENNVLTLFATRRLGLPVLVAEHTDPAKCPIGRVWSLARRITYRQACRVVVLNQPAQEFLAGRCRTVIIPNPVPRCRDSLPEGVPPEREDVILAIGRLGPEKGYDILLAAIASMGDSADGWRLAILGDGPERGRLESLARELEIDARVSMPGVAADVRSYLSTAGIFVLSSRFEGFPMGLCEAMACGLPVVASEYSPGVYDLIEPGVNGLVIPAEDSRALAGALNVLIANPGMRHSLGARARDIARRYDVHRVMNMWERTIEDCRA